MPGTLGINEHDLSLSVHSEDSDLSKDIYGEQDEQDGDPAGNPSNNYRLLCNLSSRFLASFNY